MEAQHTGQGTTARYLSVVAEAFARQQKTPPPLRDASPSSVMGRPSLMPTVNHGRWVAGCPEQCPYAITACEALPVFICPYHEVWQRVEWPENRREIEAELEIRPIDEVLGNSKANWTPEQTVQDLRVENAEYFYQLGEHGDRYADIYAEMDAAQQAEVKTR